MLNNFVIFPLFHFVCAQFLECGLLQRHFFFVSGWSDDFKRSENLLLELRLDRSRNEILEHIPYINRLHWSRYWHESSLRHGFSRLDHIKFEFQTILNANYAVKVFLDRRSYVLDISEKSVIFHFESLDWTAFEMFIGLVPDSLQIWLQQLLVGL